MSDDETVLTAFVLYVIGALLLGGLSQKAATTLVVSATYGIGAILLFAIGRGTRIGTEALLVALGLAASAALVGHFIARQVARVERKHLQDRL